MATPLVYGQLVPLVGRVNTSTLPINQVRWFIWSLFWQQYVDQGYADVYNVDNAGAVVALRVDGTVSTYTALPTTGMVPGTVFVVGDTGRIYVWNNGWPPEPQGISVQGPRGVRGNGISGVSVEGNVLRIHTTDGVDLAPVSLQVLADLQGAATDAATARDAAVVARTGAETARTGAEAARDAAAGYTADVEADAQAAAASEAAATAAKTAAETARDGAATSRTASEAAAALAETARDTALDYRNTAQGHATAAGTSATAAAGSATAADGSKTAAQQARTGAETARDAAASSATAAAGSATAAGTAKDTAVSSATSASGSAAAAVNAKTSAETARDEASTSATSAAGSATAAEGSKTAAAASAAAAATSAAEATAAKTAAATSETNAATSATSAAGSASNASTDAAAADNARVLAEQAAEDAQQAGGVPTTRQVIAGTGLSGGGPLGVDVTVSLSAATQESLEKANLSASEADLTQLRDEAVGSFSYLAAGIENRQQVGEKGQPDGYAGLDSSGKVPAGQLPSYVDDVLTYVALSELPAVGEVGKIYVVEDSNRVYRWNTPSATYIEVSPSPGSTDAVPEGAANLYFTAARARDALAAQLVGKANTYTGQTNTVWRGTQAAYDALPTAEKNVAGFVAVIL